MEGSNEAEGTDEGTLEMFGAPAFNCERCRGFSGYVLAHHHNAKIGNLVDLQRALSMTGATEILNGFFPAPRPGP